MAKRLHRTETRRPYTGVTNLHRPESGNRHNLTYEFHGDHTVGSWTIKTRMESCAAGMVSAKAGRLA